MESLYVLFRKINYREIDKINESSVTENEKYYIYTGKGKKKIDILVQGGSAVKKTELRKQEIKIYVNKNTGEIKYEIN